jgi:hypothetical protein
MKFRKVTRAYGPVPEGQERFEELAIPRGGGLTFDLACWATEVCRGYVGRLLVAVVDAVGLDVGCVGPGLIRKVLSDGR